MFDESNTNYKRRYLYWVENWISTETQQYRGVNGLGRDSAAIVFPRGLHFHIQVSLFIMRSNIQLVETVYLLRLRGIFVRSEKITLRMSFGLFFISAWSGMRLPISLQQKAWAFTRQGGSAAAVHSEHRKKQIYNTKKCYVTVIDVRGLSQQLRKDLYKTEFTDINTLTLQQYGDTHREQWAQHSFHMTIYSIWGAWSRSQLTLEILLICGCVTLWTVCHFINTFTPRGNIVLTCMSSDCWRKPGKDPNSCNMQTPCCWEHVVLAYSSVSFKVDLPLLFRD